jgi:hypothetical protein
VAGMAVGVPAVWGLEPARLVVDVGTPVEPGVGGTDPPGLGSVTVPALAGVVESPDAGMAVVAVLGEPAPGVVAAPAAGVVSPWLAGKEFVGPPTKRVDRESAKPAGAAWYEDGEAGDVDGWPGENPWFDGLEDVAAALGPLTAWPETSSPLVTGVPGTNGTLAGLAAAELTAAGAAEIGAEVAGPASRLLTPDVAL